MLQKLCFTLKKLLILHNEYQIPGGEDIAVNNEIEFLENHYEIKKIIFSNKIDNYMSQSINFIRNGNTESTKILNQELNSFKPDGVYIHNTWFKASLSVFKLLQDKNIKPLLKLHNYRYDCTKSHYMSVHLEKGNPCRACGLEAKNNKKFNKYYENSYSKSLFINKYGKEYFKILKSFNLDLIVLTNFHKKYLQEVNLIDKKISVIPNVIDIQESPKLKNETKYIIYAGRISKEKGVESLIDAFMKCNLKGVILKIVGDGPSKNYLQEKYNNNKVEFIKLLPNKEVLKLINNSLAVVTATKLYEGQPTLLCEASAMGVPSIFPQTGGILEFFPNNYELSFKQFDYEDLESKLNLLSDLQKIESIGLKNKKFINSYLNKEDLLNKFESLTND